MTDVVLAFRNVFKIDVYTTRIPAQCIGITVNVKSWKEKCLKFALFRLFDICNTSAQRNLRKVTR